MQQPSGIYEELRKEKKQSAKSLTTCDMLNKEHLKGIEKRIEEFERRVRK